MNYSEAIKELKAYEMNEYKKAFLDGSGKAWKFYKLKVRRKIAIFEDKYGVKINVNQFMS